MKRYEAIIQSKTAPNTSSLWLHDRKLKYFDGGWQDIEGAYDKTENKELENITGLLVGKPEILEEYESILEEIKHMYSTQSPIPMLNGLPSDTIGGYIGIQLDDIVRTAVFPSLWDKFIFIVDDNSQESRDHNIEVTRLIGRYGPRDGMYYTVPVYVYSAYFRMIPAIWENHCLFVQWGSKFQIYNVDINEGSDSFGRVTLLKEVNLSLLPTYINLELGNSSEVMSYNLEQLYKVSGTQFFVHADYGIGVGSWLPAYGGETTIQTAGGDRVHYIITPEGECKKQEDRFEHSELFFNLGEIDVSSLPTTVTIRNSVDMNKFRKATSLAFEANNNGAFIDDVSMNQVSVNSLLQQRIYTSPDIICSDDQNWNYIKATASTYSDRIEVYIETL